MISRADLKNIKNALLRPLRTQLANMATRAVVTLVNNAASTQVLQITALVDEPVEDVEHVQPYGFSSVPGPGAEAVVVCPEGDRAKATAVVVSQPGSRPTDQVEHEVAVYHIDGHRLSLLASGDITIACRPGQKVIINDGSGGAELATLADLTKIRNELADHEHGYIPALHPGPGVALTTLGPAVSTPLGTTVLRGK